MAETSFDAAPERTATVCSSRKYPGWRGEAAGEMRERSDRVAPLSSNDMPVTAALRELRPDLVLDLRHQAGHFLGQGSGRLGQVATTSHSGIRGLP